MAQSFRPPLYAHADERLRKQLETHLSLLRQQGIIATWHDRQIVPGTDWTGEIDMHLATAGIILLLISPDFIASDYCYGVELQRAMQRHDAGEAKVIPILLRPVADWDTAPFARLAVLPTNRKPITKWRNRDDAWTERHDPPAHGCRVLWVLCHSEEKLFVRTGSRPCSSN